jgi:hypothetical protein
MPRTALNSHSEQIKGHVMTSRKISNRAIAKMYGYDESSVRGWVERGMPTDSQINAQNWIVQNIITPLRDGDTRELKAKQDLRKATAEADLKEIELLLKRRDLIELKYLIESLTGYFLRLRNQIRTIPIKAYLELFECSDPLELKIKLSAFIDEVLTEIGNYEFESDLPQDDEYENEQQGKVAGSTKENTVSNKATN